MRLHSFPDVSAAATALANEVEAALCGGLASRGKASLAVPGGRTPAPLFRALRDADLDWSRVEVTLTDERCVGAQDAASNAALVRRELLSGMAGAARFTPLFDEAPDAAAGATGAWRSVSSLPMPFDAVVLGMGEDGHFASLFPGAPGLTLALDANAVPGCVPMRAPTAPVERISLNLAALRRTRRLFLLVTGESKRALLEAAGRGGPWPIATLLALPDPPVEIYWAP